MTTYFGKELYIRFTASAFRKLRSVYVLSYFPFGFEGRMWDLIVSVPIHCLSLYFGLTSGCCGCLALSAKEWVPCQVHLCCPLL